MVPFGLEKLGIAQGMKERSVDIALDVQSRTIFFQRARGADVYIIAGWRNQRPGVIIGPPHIKSLQDVKGQRVGISDYNSIRHWALQVNLRKAGLDLERDVEWVRIGPSRKRHLDALLGGKVECAPLVVFGCGRSQESKVLTSLPHLRINGPTDDPNASSLRLDESSRSARSGQELSKALIRCYWFCRDMPKNFEYFSCTGGC